MAEEKPTPVLDIDDYKYGFHDPENYNFKSGKGSKQRNRQDDLGDEKRAGLDDRFSPEGTRAFPVAPDAAMGWQGNAGDD